MDIYKDTLNKVKVLIEDELYSSAELMLSFIIFQVQNTQIKKCVTYEVFSLYADCLVKKNEFKRAVNYYTKAIECIPKTGYDHKINLLKEKIGNCYLKIKDYTQAKRIFESINYLNRPLAVNISLGKISIQIGDLRNAILYYKMAIKQQPLAIEIWTEYIKYGGKIDDSLRILFSKDTENIKFVKDYIEAKYKIYNGQLNEAINSFQIINSKFYQNIYILQAIADCYYRLGKIDSAYFSYTQLHNADPLLMDQMDIYSSVLKEYSNKSILINRLADELIRISEERPESWIAMTHYSIMKNDLESAMAFIDRALALDNYNYEALIQKGNIYLSQSKPTNAIKCFRTALIHDPVNYAAYEGLIDSYSFMNKPAEAYIIAKKASEMMPKSARLLTLLGKTFTIDIELKDKVPLIFKKIMEIDPQYEPAILFYADFLMNEMKKDEAIEFLEKYLMNNNNNTEKINIKLGNIYLQAEEYMKALNHFQKALQLNSDSEEAKEGIENTEKKISGSDDNDNEVQNNIDEMVEDNYI
ncbi:TPR-like protein [Piromyces finnis]|uniref:TPR-like protein n=1 Tax=Piromyces finnis TaxID=1754191 RepID=A0A1Y1VIP0_9FUNG|nr:TPR-like protein [Piromyces finnis]|eukprot:ORX55962.1 TPR-like protein [Piromyces finnis]